MKGAMSMNMFRCTVCGYTLRDNAKPKYCPQCQAIASKLMKVSAKETLYVKDQLLGSAAGLDASFLEIIRQSCVSECLEVGMTLAMSHVAATEGYPEIAEAFQRCAFEAAEHASTFAELLGDSVTSSTKKNLELRAAAEFGSTEDKTRIARLAKESKLDQIHDLVLEMARVDAQHHKLFESLLRRYFQ